MPALTVTNWFGDLVSHPQVVVEAHSTEDVVAILKDQVKYPSPVRAIGSNHSTAPCGVVEGGTLVQMSNDEPDPADYGGHGHGPGRSNLHRRCPGIGEEESAVLCEHRDRQSLDGKRGLLWNKRWLHAGRIWPSGLVFD